MHNEKKNTERAPQTSGASNVPPTTSWVDSLLDGLFPQEQNNHTNVLLAFDYEAFLRKEGLSC